jgi:geranylgeranyl pyrophosphate synthase
MNSDRLNEFDLNAYLQRQSAAIDRALEQSLQQYSGEWQAIFRPNLVLATGELFGATQSSSLSFACPVELIHAYSLIHDDLPALDDDDLRRAGLPHTRCLAKAWPCWPGIAY